MRKGEKYSLFIHFSVFSIQERKMDPRIFDYLMLVLFAGAMIAIAIVTRNRSKSVNDFLLAGKKGLNGWMSAFSYGTTYFSAVIFIGYAGNFGKQFGLSAVWIGVANAIIGGLFAWLVLAKRTKNMTSALESKTMPDFFEKRYDSKNLKLVSAFIVFIFLIPYSASVYNGLSSLFEALFGIYGYGWVICLALAILTALYLFFGGYFATAVSDFVQGIIMLVGVIVMVILFMAKEPVSWDISSLTESVTHSWFTTDKGNMPWIYDSTTSLLALIMLTSFGVWALPQTVHKYYAIRDKKAIMQGTVVSTVFALIVGFVAYFVGALSPIFVENGLISAELAGDKIIPAMLVKIIPYGLMGLIAVLILSASMSTLASVSLASASVVAVDIYKGRVNKNAEDKRVNITMKVMCLVFVAISVILAILNEKFNIAAIAYLMGISWGTLAGCFMGPFVLGLLWKRTTKAGAWASIISSLSLTAFLVVFLGYHKNGFSCDFGTAIKTGVSVSPLIGVICMISSVIVTVVVSLLTKPPKKETIDKAFSKKVIE